MWQPSTSSQPSDDDIEVDIVYIDYAEPAINQSGGVQSSNDKVNFDIIYIDYAEATAQDPALSSSDPDLSAQAQQTAPAASESLGGSECPPVPAAS